MPTTLKSLCFTIWNSFSIPVFLVFAVQKRDSREPSSSLRLQWKHSDLWRFRQLSWLLPCRDRTNMSLQHKRSAWLFLSRRWMSELGKSSRCKIQLCTSHASSGMNLICQLPWLAKLHNKCTEDTGSVHPLSPARVYVPCAGEGSGITRNSKSTAETESQTGWLESAHIYKRWQSTLKKTEKIQRDSWWHLQQVFRNASSHPSEVATCTSDTAADSPAALGLLSSNINNTCTVSRTDTLLLKDLRTTVGLQATKINTFVNARKHGWKQLRSPALLLFSVCISGLLDVRLTLWQAPNVSWWKPLKTWWLFMKCYVLACHPKPYSVSTAPEEILFGALAGTRNRKIFDTSVKSWMCNTKS